MRVLLVDDHQLMREGLRSLLEKAGLSIVGEASNGRDALARSTELLPDIVLMDISMPGLNGIDATRRLLAQCPNVKVLGLSMNPDRRYVNALLAAGGRGFLLKHVASEELIRAIQAVAAGQVYVNLVLEPEEPPLVSPQDPEEPASPRGHSNEPKPLSLREREVLQLLAEGKSSKRIAATLNIATGTVETYRRQIMGKLSLRTIAELTKYAIREGITAAD
jgi:DNA-binding NarL/FixJ family response regulator